MDQGSFMEMLVSIPMETGTMRIVTIVIVEMTNIPKCETQREKGVLSSKYGLQRLQKGCLGAQGTLA